MTKCGHGNGTIQVAISGARYCENDKTASIYIVTTVGNRARGRRVVRDRRETSRLAGEKSWVIFGFFSRWFARYGTGKTASIRRVFILSGVEESVRQRQNAAAVERASRQESADKMGSICCVFAV